LTESTAVVSHAINLLQEGSERLRWGPQYGDRTELAANLLSVLGALMEEYAPEHFTEDEIELISATTLLCIEVLVTHTHQQEENDEI